MTFDQTKQFFKRYGSDTINFGDYSEVTIDDLFEHFQNRMMMERQPQFTEAPFPDDLGKLVQS